MTAGNIMNKVDTFRFNDALAFASNAFWAEIAKQFPECKSGDFPPDATLQWDEQVGRFLTIWLDCNHPSAAATVTTDARRLVLAAEVAGIIEGATASGYNITDDIVIAFILDNTLGATIPDIRVALIDAGYADRFPGATASEPDPDDGLPNPPEG